MQISQPIVLILFVQESKKKIVCRAGQKHQLNTRYENLAAYNSLFFLFPIGFSPNKDGNKVFIAGIPCKMTYFTKTEIRCTTGPRKGTIETKVRVEVDGKGMATQDQADFQYIDVWSSPYTWGCKNPPGKGDGVVIPAGQTILLDVDTPVFSFLVIRGELIFDEKNIALNSEKILVVDGGKLQVGTETKPFEHKAKIILHGHLHNKRMPIFGTKVLAVREGTLDLHGKVVPITWTNLAKTALPGL